MNYSKMRLTGATLASIYFLHYILTYRDWHFIDWVNLIFHEAGHAIFTSLIFGQFISIAMGSGFQILLPFLIALYFFFYLRDSFSGAICLMWVGQNMINVSLYAGDAIIMQLPLLGGDSVIHDWNYLLSTLNILTWTPKVAGSLYMIGIFTILLGITFSFMTLFFGNNRAAIAP